MRIHPEEKRQFLLRIMGAARVKALEDCTDDEACSLDLARKEEELVSGYKQDLAIQPPATPSAGATSWADLAAAEELAAVEAQIGELWSDFMGVAGNIRTSDTPMSEKSALLKKLVADFIKAIGEVKGAKAVTGLGVEVAQAVDAFDEAAGTAGSDVAALRTAVQKLVERLRVAAGAKARNNPVAPYLDDLRKLLGPKKPVNAKAMKEIAASGNPLALYVAGLTAGHVERGG